MFEIPFSGGIENIFIKHSEHNSHAEKPEEPFVIGPIVSLPFFWGDHLTQTLPRGPFKTSLEWLRTRLQFVLQVLDHTLRTSKDESNIEDAEFAKELASELLEVLPAMFAPSAVGIEPTILFHDDLPMQNIIVDDDGALTAIIDWECVAALSLWRACQLPLLLEGRRRDEKPGRGNYAADRNINTCKSSRLDALDNEGVDELYWDHLLEYEQTQLREVFVEHMKTIQPRWIDQLNDSRVAADIEKAVHGAENPWVFKTVRRWLKAFVSGNTESLADKFVE